MVRCGGQVMFIYLPSCGPPRQKTPTLLPIFGSGGRIPTANFIVSSFQPGERGCRGARNGIGAFSIVGAGFVEVFIPDSGFPSVDGALNVPNGLFMPFGDLGIRADRYRLRVLCFIFEQSNSADDTLAD